jgi:RimJ/RimL family protein N-acetyltransferase
MRGVSHLPSDGVIRLDDFLSSDVPTLILADQDFEHRRRFEVPLGFEPSIQHAEQTLATWFRNQDAGLGWALAVRDCVTDEALGGCELRPSGTDAAQLSYWTYPAHRSRGIGTRAVALMCRWAFEQFRFERIELAIDCDNQPSRMIALRNGFSECGLRDGRVRYVKERSGAG